MEKLSTMKYEDFVALGEMSFIEGRDTVALTTKNSGLFRFVDIADHTGMTREFTEQDNELFLKRKGESEQAKKLKDVQGFKKIGRLIRFAGEKDISHELRKHNKYQDVVSKFLNLGKLGQNTIERDLCHVFKYGSAGTYTDSDGEVRDLTTADGRPLFDAAHQMKATGKTFSNILSGNPQFSQTAFTNMLELRRVNSINHFGQKLAIKDDIIWSSDDTKTTQDIRRELVSTSQVGQENSNVINVLPKYRTVELPYLDTDANGSPEATGTKYWGVASSVHTELVYAESEAPHMKMPGVSADGTVAEDFSTDDVKVGARGEWMIVTVAPYGQAGSFPTV